MAYAPHSGVDIFFAHPSRHPANVYIYSWIRLSPNSILLCPP